MKANIDAVKAKVAKAQEQLEAKLAALQTSDDWKAQLERMAILGATSINRYYAEHRIMPGSRRRAQFPEGTGVLQLESSRH